jgi:hypothetical protein
MAFKDYSNEHPIKKKADKSCTKDIYKGKFHEADKTGACHNCGERVGAKNLVTNHNHCWPVCRDCDFELDLDWEE